MKPSVSIIVATYRRDAFLQRALDSLTTQTYNNFDIILVDDNDDSQWNEKVQLIVDKYRIEHPDISLTYIQNHPTLGSAKTRNVGISASTSEYICFLDDDDVYLPERITNQVLLMIKENADYSVTNIALYSDSDRLIEIRNREYIKSAEPEALTKYHLLYHITGTDTMMFKRDYLSKIGAFSAIDVGDEYYLMQKAIDAKGKFLHVPVCDVKAYVHTGEGGLSSGQTKIDGENYLYSQKKKYFDLLDKKSIRYVKVRHHAVLAYAYLRMKCYFKFLFESIKGFFVSPLGLIKVFLNR